jgi:hypothetical protein
MAETEGDQDLASERGQFRAEYERELGQWLRRRLGYLCIAFTVFQILSVTALTLSAMLYTPAPEEPQLPTRVERRAEEAERRAEAGLPLRPMDARALAAVEAEKRRLEREQGAQAVVSTLDAFSMIARDFAPKGYARQILKDLELLNSAAKPHHLAMPMSAQALTLFRMLVAQGNSELDGIAVLTLLPEPHSPDGAA